MYPRAGASTAADVPRPFRLPQQREMDWQTQNAMIMPGQASSQALVIAEGEPSR